MYSRVDRPGKDSSKESLPTAPTSERCSTNGSRKSSEESLRRQRKGGCERFLSGNSDEDVSRRWAFPSALTDSHPYTKPNGHVSNPLSYDDTFRLKATPQAILRRGVRNLHLKNIPAGFTVDDVELLLDESKESLLLINHPYSKSQHKFLTYCFVLLDDEREAAALCRKWDRKTLVDCCGNSRRMQVFQGVQSPREFLLKLLHSKGVNHKVLARPFARCAASPAHFFPGIPKRGKLTTRLCADGPSFSCRAAERSSGCSSSCT